jgi:hypothetical protein
MFFFNHFLHGYALMNSFYIACTYTGGITKKTVNLNFSFEKADSTPPPPHLPRKGSQIAKKSVSLPQYSKTVFMNTVKKSRLILNTGSKCGSRIFQ